MEASRLTAARQIAASAAAEGDGAVAVGEACEAAVDALDGDPGLVLAFAAGPLDAEAAAGGMVRAAPGAICAGLTGSGVFTADGPLEQGCAAIAFDRSTRAGLGVGVPEGDRLRQAGHDAAEAALADLGEGPGSPLLILLLDFAAGDIAEAIAGAYEACGPGVPLAGGACAGSHPFQMAAGEALTGSVVAVAVRRPKPFGIGNAQACETIGETSIVTRSEGNVILEIDGRPAQEVYLEQLGLDGGPLSDEDFASMAITHPLAQPELHGNRRLRHVLGRAGKGSLRCSTHIPASAAIEFTVLGRRQLVRSGWDSVGSALEALDGRPAEAALVFDCAGRRKVLGEALDEEVAAIADSFGDPGPPPTIGLYTSGEVARTRGAKGDYNHAVVTVAFT